MNYQQKVSVCVITKNEEARIERCLKSVAWADEIIVVDSGSTDATCDICKKLGAKVFYHKWAGWAKQKNTAIGHSTHDWILSLDSDEWLPEKAEKKIRAALNGKADSYFLGRRTKFLGEWIQHSGWYPDKQIRLFRKSATRFEEVPVHEKVLPTSLSKDLDLDIWHESYTSIEQWYEKNRSYSAAQALQQKDQNYPFLKLILKPVYRFLQTYIFQQGYLDGGKGLQLALLRSGYEFSVCWQIIQLRLAED